MSGVNYPTSNPVPLPREPERLTAGRYGEARWGYDGMIGTYDEMGRRYEHDRAEYYKALSERQRHELEMIAQAQEDEDREAERARLEDEHAAEIDDMNIPKAGRDL